MKFNEKLKVLREQKEYTQEEIANKIGIARQSVSKWENGINEPDFDTLKKLCQILDCSIADLIDDDKELETTKEQKANKTTKKLVYANVAITIASILILFAFFVGMNDEIIIHWDHLFNPTYGPKLNALFLLLCPVVGLSLSIILEIYSDHNCHYHKYKVMMQIVSLVIQILILVLMIVTLSFMDTYSIVVSSSLFAASALSLIFAMGIFTHPKFNKRNPLFGLKTNFTLSSEVGWNKVNSFASIVISATALISYALVLIFIDSVYSVYFIGLLFVGVIIAFIQHEVVRHNINKK